MMLPLLIAALFVGCSGQEEGPRTVPAKGVITLDGEPVNGAAIVFVTTDGSYPASGQSDEDGRFSLNSFEYKDGAVPGTYMVSIVKNEEIVAESSTMKGEAAEHSTDNGKVQLGVRNALPEKYRNPTPNFTMTIPEDGTTDLSIVLTSK